MMIQWTWNTQSRRFDRLPDPQAVEPDPYPADRCACPTCRAAWSRRPLPPPDPATHAYPPSDFASLNVWSNEDVATATRWQERQRSIGLV